MKINIHSSPQSITVKKRKTFLVKVQFNEVYSKGWRGGGEEIKYMARKQVPAITI